jgi:hypothetical protein
MRLFQFQSSDIGRTVTGSQSYRALVLCILMIVSLQACSSTREMTRTARSPVEQLLISQSIERGLNIAAALPAPKGAAVIEAEGLTDDKKFARDVVAQWLRQQGWQIINTGGDVQVNLIIYSLGTEQRETFVGVPPVSGTLVPISTPELALYKASRQRGYARFTLTVSDAHKGSLVNAAPVIEGETYFNQYTVFFAFSFHSTDLAPPP